MAMKVPDLEDVTSDFDIAQYGIGVPAVLFMLSLALLYRAFDGMVIYYQMNVYGKIGVVFLLGCSMLAMFLSGWSFDKVDRSVLLKTEEEDKAELIEEG